MRTLRRIALLLVLAVLLPTGVARAGGWATVELGEAPSGLVAGEPWHVELIVKQHGVTPLAGLEPSIQISDRGGATRTFRARPTGAPGTYVADVTFPSAGTWSARISDGFTDAVPHRISTLDVAPGTGAAVGGSGFPWEQTIAIALVALLWMGGWIAGYGWPHPHMRAHSPFHPRLRRAA